jgi:hypothetical protein
MWESRRALASLASLKRWVAANLPEEVNRNKVTVLGADAVAGGQAQIDYGMLGTWTDPLSGKRHRVWAFVMVLAFSRLMFVRPVLRMDQAAWTRAHVEAFAFFGGVPARLVPDNLKTRVERPMPYVRDSFWRGREFTSIEQMQAEAIRWCTEVAGQRQCRPLAGAAPAAVFAAAEAEALKPLPVQPFVLAVWSRAKVGPDIHIKAGKSLYSVPWRHIGHQVDVRSTAATVQIFCCNELVATHVFKSRGKQTDMAHYPPEKIAFNMKNPAWCRRRASLIGPACVEVISELLAVNALYRLRSAQGVLGLADKHGAGRLEKACERAIRVGDPSYRTIKGILVAGTEQADPGDDYPAGVAGDGGAAAYLHGPGTLFEDFAAYPQDYPNVVALPTASQAPVAAPGTANDAHRGHQDDEPGAHRGHGDDEPDVHEPPARQPDARRSALCQEAS